ncbi:hypothetical protein [Streptomyces tendae]|uniref:hypothetical protein n=1 Tax=Streptomyces tendae TaxID=1932 RepID=UPI00371BD7D4
MTAGVSDVSANTSSRVEVYVDGESLFTGQVDLGKPRELKLKIENGLRLRIAYSDPEDSCEMGDLLLADPTLTRRRREGAVFRTLGSGTPPLQRGAG